MRWLLLLLLCVSAVATPRADDDSLRAATTLKRMNTVATAIEAYMIDHDSAPEGTSVEALRQALSPAYIRELPLRDAWDTPLRYIKTGKQSFQIVSAGSDRKFDEKSWAVEAHTTDFAADAVYVKAGPDKPGTFRRVWVGALGAPLALTTDEMNAHAQDLVRAELEKMKGMSQEESRTYLATSSTKRSMFSFSVLIELYKRENGTYPAASSMAELANALFSGAASDIDTKDAWGTELRYVRTSDGTGYQLVSAGADRTFDESSWSKPAKPLATADDDAVIRNGVWIRSWDEHTRPGETAESKRRKTLKPAAREMLERADALHTAGKDAEALDAYMSAVKADPAAADLATIKRYALAADVAANERAALRQYLQIRPGDWDATAELAMIVGDLPESESLLKPFFATRPRDRELYRLRAALRSKHHAYADAIADYEKAAELDPHDAEGQYIIGVVLYEAVAKDTALTETQKREWIDRGITALRRAEEMKKDYFEAMVYESLLIRQQAQIEKDPETQKRLIAEADALRARAVGIIQQKKGPAAPPPAQEQQPLAVGGDVKAPVVIHRVEPVYHGPGSGIVILQTVIDKTGHVARVEVLKPIPSGGSEAAVEAVKQWTFKPGTRNGEPVDVVFNLTVRIAPGQ